MSGTVQKILRNKNFMNEINIVIKSMIFICQNRKSFFANYTNILFQVNIEYNCLDNNEYNYNDNFNFNYVIKIKNTFFSIGKKNLSLQNEYNILNENVSLLNGLLTDAMSNYYETLNAMINCSLKRTNLKKVIVKTRKKMSVISKSYLKIYLLKFLKNTPEEIINTILSYI